MFNDGIFLEDFGVVLQLDEDGVYSPTHYQTENGWVIIEDGDIIRDWIMYVKIAFSQIDKVTRETKVGNLFTYQWGFSIMALQKIMEFNADTLDVEWSRQLITGCL